MSSRPGNPIRAKTTQYGYKDDPCGDSLTKAGYGCFDAEGLPSLKVGDCALTKSLQEALGAVMHDMIKAKWPNGDVLVFRFNDRAPESDFRLDIYHPDGFDSTIGDYADISLA